jgi:hypothetical protein
VNGGDDRFRRPRWISTDELADRLHGLRGQNSEYLFQELLTRPHHAAADRLGVVELIPENGQCNRKRRRCHGLLRQPGEVPDRVL